MTAERVLAICYEQVRQWEALRDDIQGDLAKEYLSGAIHATRSLISIIKADGDKHARS